MRETDDQRQERYVAEDLARPELSMDQYRKRSRRSFLWGGAASVAGLMGWRWVQTQETRHRIPGILRTGHELNETIWSGLFRDRHEAPTFDRSESSILRVNGRLGLSNDISVANWKLRVQDRTRSTLVELDLGDVKALPKREMTVEHKCIEGWSQIVTWGGTPFSNLAEQVAGVLDGPSKYVYFETPDGKYFVSMDWDSVMHPQTLLTYEMQGEPLDQAHGAPLRLTTPLKYGIKQIKRIGTIRFTNRMPRDYWGERGYDWYAGL